MRCQHGATCEEEAQRHSQAGKFHVAYSLAEVADLTDFGPTNRSIPYHAASVPWPSLACHERPSPAASALAAPCSCQCILWLHG
jgi:hypothetical protein